jgi:hypothetical protein
MGGQQVRLVLRKGSENKKPSVSVSAFVDLIPIGHDMRVRQAVLPQYIIGPVR